eukprot:1194868-Prorocentrum_minimum.AAC.1
MGRRKSATARAGFPDEGDTAELPPELRDEDLFPPHYHTPLSPPALLTVLGHWDRQVARTICAALFI